MISCMISYISDCIRLCFLTATEVPQAQPADSIDNGHDNDQEMDFDDEHDFADQGPLSDMDMEEDAQILATLFETYSLLYKHG